MSRDKENIPAFLKENLESNILGKIKLNIYKQISGEDNVFPGERNIKRFVRNELRSNSEIGKLYLHLLGRSSLTTVQYSKLEESKNAEKLLLKLEENPNYQVHILELNQLPKPFTDSIGVCVFGEHLLPEGCVYVFTFFDAKFPEFILSRIEVRAYRKYPNPIFSELVKSDWKEYDFTNYKDSFFVTLALKILKFISENQQRYLFTVNEAAALNLNENRYNPPFDKNLLILIKAVAIGKLTASTTSVELSKIKPRNLNFCLDFPKDLVDVIVQEIQKGENYSLLVYWNGKYFVMSDDYPVYLAYKTLDTDKVSVVILGNFPINLAMSPVTKGGLELLPPVGVEHSPNYDSFSDELQNWILEQNLKRKKQSEVISNLYLLFIGLNELISNPNTLEREIHNFIINNPSCFDIYGSRIMSEVRLGKKYRVDLALQYKLDEKKIQLVELERANEKIFTEKGRLRSYVTHAIQQVEDWLQWWEENPNERPEEFDSSVLPEGLVVIGRNKNLSEDDKKRILHLNSTRKVKLITYDDLLQRIEALIENLEDAENKERKTSRNKI